MKFGYFRRDDDAHNYLVPEEVVKDFDDAMEYMYELSADSTKYMEFLDACNDFNEKFGKYRIDGISDYKVVMLREF